MRGWTYLLVIPVVAVLGTASGQQAFLQHAASGLKPAQRASDKANSTGNLIFWSVSSLLQHWPNTRYINGHTITAATVPPGTILYHGRSNNDRPMTLDWLATDPEHSFVFCWGKCYLYTYVTTRPLRLAYFDGSSASKVMSSGVMDTQDIVIWGKVRSDMARNERVRIQELCKWGEQYKLDGFVRMEMDFEIMICDFDAGMKLISESKVIPHITTEGRFYSDFINLSHRALLPRPPPHRPAPELPPGWRGSARSEMSTAFEVLNAGMWHNRPPGETRIKIDYSRILSFFDPALSSLVRARAGKSKEEFRLDEISEADSKYTRDKLDDIFTRDGQGSGIDWGSITQVVVDRYGKRLELLQHILQNPESNRNVTEQVAEARSQVLIMLTPYMLVSAIPPNLTGPVNRSWIDPVVKHCASTHIAWTPETLLTPQEKSIKAAVEEVLSQICGVLGDIWVDAFDSENSNVKELERFLTKWQLDITQLMDWLDWSVWLKCKPACGPEEICYIPTWPWGYRFGRNEVGKVDMTPRCVEAVVPYSFLQPSRPGPHSS
ncbi:hypothetical protein BDM02DRAFT_3086829 [Thelephora ganbajun]|uniref:Uncharacterized protein n=1 Tax=Thelephora ganbajun TaxID=370292 RepID=A0ACB6ZXB4_THEGA|nr:hypothetical protein BDM02DRAFT_3086829 [Thelephora ganbajun]